MLSRLRVRSAGGAVHMFSPPRHRGVRWPAPPEQEPEGAYPAGKDMPPEAACAPSALAYRRDHLPQLRRWGRIARGQLRLDVSGATRDRTPRRGSGSPVRRTGKRGGTLEMPTPSTGARGDSESPPPSASISLRPPPPSKEEIWLPSLREWCHTTRVGRRTVRRPCRATRYR